MATVRKCLEAAFSWYMSRLQDQQKWEIVNHWKLHKNISQAARACNVSLKVARTWIKRFQETGTVACKEGQGRKQLLSAEDASLAVDLLISDKFEGAEAVAKEVSRRQKIKVILHRTTLGRAAKRQAVVEGRDYKADRGRPCKDLADDTKSQRLAFCKKWNKPRFKAFWKKVLFTDRCKFHFRYPGCKVSRVQYVYKKDGKRRAKISTHPQTVNLYAGICFFGVTSCQEVEGTTKFKASARNKKGELARNITTERYKTVLRDGLLPSGNAVFKKHGISSWVFQQDNDPTHKVASAVIKVWNGGSTSKVELLDPWPPNSPDLNPIENVWSYVQARVDKLGCRDFDEFRGAVHKEIKNLPKDMLRNLVTSMPDRLDACEGAKGDRTKY